MKKFLYILIYALLAAAPVFGASESDDFERADSGDVGTTWTPIDSLGCQLVNGEVWGINPDQRCWEMYNNYLPTNDQYVEVELGFGVDGTVWQDNSEISAVVRIQAATSLDAYYCQARPSATGPTRIRKIVAGTSSTLASESGTTTWATGDVLRCEVTGSGASTTLTLKRNGTSLVTTTDPAGTYAGGYGGIQTTNTEMGIGFEGTAGLNAVETFTVGDLAAPPAPPAVRHRPLIIQ